MVEKAVADLFIGAVECAGGIGDGLWPVTLDDDVQPFGDLVECLVPAQLCPTSLAAVTKPLAWPVQTTWMVEILDRCQAPLTDETLGDRVVGIAADSDGSTILYLDEYPTAYRAVGASCALYFDFRVLSHRLTPMWCMVCCLRTGPGPSLRPTAEVGGVRTITGLLSTIMDDTIK